MGGAEARSVRPMPGAPRRKLRNYLLDWRFQLKYTSMVVGVTLVVASLFGALAYRESQGMTQSLQVQLMQQRDLDAQAVASIKNSAIERDQQILERIVWAIGLMASALGITGIFITHRMVGPAYKMKLLFASMSKGPLRVDGALRRGDELKDVFAAFHDMVGHLRTRKEQELQRIETAIRQAQASGCGPEVVDQLTDLRDLVRADLG